jgi:hypothetical protein
MNTKMSREGRCLKYAALVVVKLVEGRAARSVSSRSRLPDIKYLSVPLEPVPKPVPKGANSVGVRLFDARKYLKRLARPRGVEPLTPRSVVWCSIQLSYGRINDLGRSVTSLGTS